ncbi:MAG: dATP/dGTP diphosphohydrolase domain-containing protein [Spirochaetota bacterium]
MTEARYAAAAMRHLASYLKGQQTDSESGLSHVAHAACCCLFLAELEKKREVKARILNFVRRDGLCALVRFAWQFGVFHLRPLKN